MKTTTPDGSTVTVGRRWLPWNRITRRRHAAGAGEAAGKAMSDPWTWIALDDIDLDDDIFGWITPALFGLLLIPLILVLIFGALEPARPARTGPGLRRDQHPDHRLAHRGEAERPPPPPGASQRMGRIAGPHRGTDRRSRTAMRGVTSTAARNSLANAIVVWSPFAGSGRGTLAHAIAGHSTRRGLTAVAVSTAEPERLLSLAESQAQAADVVVVQMPSPGAFARPHEATLDPHDCLGRLAATLDAFAEHGAWLLGLTKPTPYSIETLLDVAGRMHGTGKHGGSGFVVVNPETTRPGESIDPLTKSLMRSVFGETRILGGLETSGRWRSRVDMVADVMSSLVSPQTEKPRRLA